MIKNNSQYNRIKSKIDELTQAKEAFLEENKDHESAKFQIGVNSFDAILSDLVKEKEDYESLSGGGFHIIQPKSLESLPVAIIQTRIALGYTQKTFAELMGLKEQQVQRYESEDYQGVSFDRLLDFSEALGLKFFFEKTIISIDKESVFSFGDEITEEAVEQEVLKVKNRGSLLIS
ncbi:helix-turn-helix domain-containing protein [Pedobacter alpinus]|uniref:Helix-turn-helix domain-containing protein n=1 Tax=Pedobacter alpinus TaxID=1590643 RepID=A0ABW5TXH4_9SPHI